MSNIPVEKLREASALPRPLLEQMDSISAKIRNKAYELYLMRGSTPGSDLEDWLQAERQLMWLPDTELSEKEKEFQVRIQMQGLEPKDLRIIALPNSIVLQAEPKSRESKLFQRLDFTSGIDPERVTAKLDKGMLQMVVPKIEARQLEMRRTGAGS
jgi:HSP20 family molecular chaperone IbpA